jgi:hypothetical protein
MSQELITLKLDEIHLWTQNPRDPVDENSSDEDIIRRAVDDPESRWRLTQLIENMGDDYDSSELPTVVNKNGSYIAYDGNKRLAALKCIQNNDLYNITSGRLFLSNVPDDLQNIESVTCNLCDEETAIKHVRRKHFKRGDWKHLERDAFDHYIAGQEKSVFLKFDEATGLISSDPKMNAENVKSEIVTERNLNAMGFGFNEDKLNSMYDQATSTTILGNIQSIIDQGLIKQGDKENRGQLKKVYSEQFQNSDADIIAYEVSSKTTPVSTSNFQRTSKQQVRLTPATKQANALFDGKLSLRSGKTNDLYRAIASIYDFYNRRPENQIVMPIICMSLRLLLDIAAHEYFEEHDSTCCENAYTNFLRLAKTEIRQNQSEIFKNDAALLTEWLDSAKSFEGVLGKWAHGSLSADEDMAIRESRIIAILLKKYFGKD